MRPSQSRREMQEALEQQRQQLSVYEVRLKDVVKAYKGLLKEKEALEKSLAAIHSHPPTTPAGTEHQSSAVEAKDEAQADEAAVNVLTSSLAVVSAEKSKLEAQFQELKRRSRDEREDKAQQIKALSSEISQAKEAARRDLEEAKSKWIVERHLREKESSDHAVMLRELQKVVADERAAKEKLNNQLQQAKDNLKALELAGTYNQEYEKRVRELEELLSSKDVQIASLQTAKAQEPEQLTKLNQSVADLMANHALDLKRAEQRTWEAEERAVQLRAAQEERVANLEARLQELSDTVGSYDRLRNQDQQSIQKLKERIQRLVDEKQSTAIQPASSPAPVVTDDADQDSNLDVHSLVERIIRLKALARGANKRSENPLDLDELFEVMGDRESASHWKKKYHQLSEELDKLKMAPPLDSSPPRARILSAQLDEAEIVNLRSQLNALNSRLTSLRQQFEQSQARVEFLEGVERSLQESLLKKRTEFKERLEQREMELKTKIMTLEAELQKQRERCVTLISEKEEEVATLRANFEFVLESLGQGSREVVNLRAASALAQSSLQARPRLLSGSGSLDEVTENLKQLASHQSDGMVLHYVQELARCEVEIKSLRKKNHDIELAMREIQMSFGAKEEKYVDQIDLLRESVSRLRRMTTTEGANLEYLKNVVLNYMLSSDLGSKEHMLKAIAAVLHFSEPDVAKVKAYNASWWAGSSSASSSAQAKRSGN